MNKNPKVGEYWMGSDPTETMNFLFLVLAVARFNRKKCYLCAKCDWKTKKIVAEDPQDHILGQVRWFDYKLQSGDDAIGKNYYTLCEPQGWNK